MRSIAESRRARAGSHVPQLAAQHRAPALDHRGILMASVRTRKARLGIEAHFRVGALCLLAREVLLARSEELLAKDIHHGVHMGHLCRLITAR